MEAHPFGMTTRRTFLAGSGAALGAALAGAAHAQRTEVKVPPVPGKKLGFALVGLGKFSVEQLLPSFAACEHCKVTAFVSGSPDKARALAKRYGVAAKSIYRYEDFDKLRDNAEVDVVYVVLPNHLHAEYTIRAAKAGKHVLCEKPMAVTSRECRKMIDACKEAGKKLMVGYRLRYEPYNIKAIELARKKAVGRVQLVVADNAQQVPPGTWRTNKEAGGGPLPDIGVYCIQAARYLTGEEPAEVSGALYRPKDDKRFKEVEQRCLFTLRFPSGAEAHCSCDYGLSTTSRYRAIGAEGAIDLDPAFKYSGLKMRVIKENGEERPKLPDVNQFAAEMDHLATCIKDGKEPLTPGEEGLRDVTVIEKIYEAARSGRPVKL